MTLASRYIGVGSPDGGHVVGLKKVDDIAHGVKPLLHGIVYLMMHRADMFRHFSGGGKVGCTLEPNCKRMEPWPVGGLLSVVFNTVGSIFRRHGGYDG